MENNNRNDQNSRDWTLDELLNTGIDDILNDLPDLNVPYTPEGVEESVCPDDPAMLFQEPQEAVEAIRSAKPAKQNRREKKDTSSGGVTMLTYLHDLAYLLAGLVLAFLLLFRVVVVSGTSMNNTLLDGDYLLVLSSTFYQQPKYGDVIVASKKSFDDGAPIVKRVIATEGQKVDIDFENGIVYVDDVPLEEDYTLTLTTIREGVSFPLTVDEGCVFVLGDNRDGSKDSRHPEIGQIDKREILGKVFFLFFPGTNYGEFQIDYGRIGVVD